MDIREAPFYDEGGLRIFAVLAYYLRTCSFEVLISSETYVILLCCLLLDYYVNKRGAFFLRGKGTT